MVRQSRRKKFSCGAALVVATCFVGVHAALWEPEGNKVILGAWLDDEPGSSDFATNLTARLSPQLPPISNYLLGQGIPIPQYFPANDSGGGARILNLARANTRDQHVFLTVYPDRGLNSFTDADLEILGNQLADYERTYGYKTFLRWAPEMSGVWNPGWGLQPTLYIATWRRMHTIIKRLSPNTAFVWSPNVGYGYPSGGTLPANPQDAAALDTDHDGQLTINDDPYAPYYPGDDYTDWHGISIYYKGPAHLNRNEPQPGGYCSDLLHGVDPYGGASSRTPYDFYKTYCAEKPTKACAFSESGAVYHVDLPTSPAPLVDQVALQRAWWRDCITNATFLDAHPRLKMINLFEWEKVENDGGIADLRDFRITNNTAVLSALKADLAAMQDRFDWATSNETSPVSTSSLAPSPTGRIAGVVTPAGGRSTTTFGQASRARMGVAGAATAVGMAFLLLI